MPAPIVCKACGTEICDDSQVISASQTQLLLIPCLPSLLSTPPALDPSSLCITQTLTCPYCRVTLGRSYIATTEELSQYTDKFVVDLSAVDWPGFVSVKNDTELMAAEMTAACEYLRKAEVRINHLEVCNRLLGDVLVRLREKQ